MLTGLDTFSTQVIALRHQGPLREEVKTLAEILKDAGYDTTCVGFGGTKARVGLIPILTSLDGVQMTLGRSPKAENLNKTTLPELNRLIDQTDEKPFFLFLRHMDPHSPYLPPAPYERTFYHGDECDPSNKSMEPVMAFKPFCDYFRLLDATKELLTRTNVIAQYDGASRLHGRVYSDAFLMRLKRAV